MKNIYVALKYEVPASKNTFTASLRAIQVVDKSDQSIVFSFTYRDATDQEKQDHRAIFDAEMTEYEAQKGETTDLMTAFINGNSRWLIPPHQNPLEGYIEWSMNLEKLKSYLSKLRNFYLLYIENKGKWIGLDKIDDRAHDIFFIPSVLVNSFTKDIGPESWNDFIDNVIGDLKKIEGKEKIGQDAFESDEYFLPRPEIEEVLYWETLKIFKSKLVWNITDDEGANHSIMANSFESSWKALAQRISTISYVSNIKEENARIYNANVNSPFINLLKEYSNLGYKETDFIRKYLKIFDIGNDIKIDYDPKYQLIKVIIVTFDGIERELIDFGYGIKQLILILIQISILAQKSKDLRQEYDEEYGEVFNDYYAPGILLIEEPESNLHPKWQSVMATMFAEANSEFKIQLIVETHSEYLIRKLQNLVADGELKPQSVKIFYLRNLHKIEVGKGQVESLFIQDDGSIDYTMFDSGFFDESTNLEFSLLNIRRENFIKEFEDLKQNNDDNVDKIAELQQKVDAYTDKVDLNAYSLTIHRRFDTSKLSPVSVKYLVSGQYLLSNISAGDDFSPVILQYGRTIENELLKLFNRVDSNGNWSIGKMQAAMEHALSRRVILRGALNDVTTAQRTALGTQLRSTFVNHTNLKVGLLDRLRKRRNESGHPGHTKTRQDAVDYIRDANDFLDKWIGEMR
ncbi:AAA family ATPase [Flavobacterium sp. J372]|uniref:AAA family ATPase n=1 Tax=Flavobacterium sp. J372 TaxID=2898436 RepID=UPI002151A9FD|nr:AAA family ATPase [Flavobacterium sp. J372]MCR5862562.1 AAA family ATPase [Flavobacterium sp. J372]